MCGIEIKHLEPEIQLELSKVLAPISIKGLRPLEGDYRSTRARRARVTTSNNNNGVKLLRTEED